MMRSLLFLVLVFASVLPASSKTLKFECSYTLSCSDVAGCRDGEQKTLLEVDGDMATLRTNQVSKSMALFESDGFLTFLSFGEANQRQVVYLAEDGTSAFTVTAFFAGEFVSAHSYGSCSEAQS